MKSIAMAAELYDEVPEYDLPEVGSIGYLIDMLSEIGEAQVDGGGVRSNSWVDIKAWSDLTGIELENWEAVALVSLSREYVAQYHESSDANCPQPNVEELPQREVVEQKMKAFLMMLRGGK